MPLPQPSRVKLYPISIGLAQTGAKLRAIRDLVAEAQGDHRLFKLALELKELHPEPLEQVIAAHNFLKTHMRFTPDPYGVEYFQSPKISMEQIEQWGYTKGDCDDMVLLETSLLKRMGFPVKAVIAWTPDNFRDTPNHIFSKVKIGQEWISLEATAKHQPVGWQHDYRKTEGYDL